MTTNSVFKTKDIWIKLSIALLLLIVGGTAFAQYTTNDFAYYKTVTLNADLTAQGNNTHNDFPVLISIESDNDLVNGWGGHVESANGYDIMFFDDNGDKLDHELEYYQTWDGKYVAWVRIPAFDPTTTTDIYMYYGNSSINTDPSVSTTWNSRYTAVLHLEDNDLDESTGSYSGIVENGTWLIDVANNPKIGRSRGYSGWNNYIEIPVDAINDDGNFTISFWFNPSSTNDRTLFDAGSNNSSEEHFYSSFNSNSFRLTYEDNSNKTYDQSGNTTVINTGEWYYINIIGSFNDREHRIYINDTRLFNNNNTMGDKSNSYQSIRFGSSSDRSYNNSNNDFHGMIDEIRISDRIRGNNWIRTEYANQNSPAAFVTYGTEQQVSSGVDFLISASVTDVSCYGLSDGSATLTVSGGNPPYTITWNNGQTGETISDVAAAVYTATIVDNDGVTETYDVTIGEPDELIFTVLSITGDPCGGTCDGEFTYSIAGGTMPYSLSWDPTPISFITYSKEISFTGNEYLEDYQLKLTVNYESHMESDFSDIRFMDSGSNALDFWIEEYTTSTSATVWVNVPVINTGANTVTMTYGDASASGGSSFENSMNNGGLNAEYYYYGYGSSGPTIDPSKLVAVCPDITTSSDDRPIDHDWSSGQIDLCGQTTGDYVLISWYGWLKKPDDATGDNFNLRCGSDDGFRLMLDDADRNNPTSEYWNTRSYNTTTSTYTFSDDVVAIVYDLWENTGEARATFEWYYPGVTSSYQIVPQSQFYYSQYSDNPPSNITFSAEQASNIYTSTGQCSGSYTLTVTDENGCTDSKNITIATDEVLLSTTVSDISCNGLSDGSIDVSVTCSVAPYIVSWSHGPTDLSLSGLSAGDYTITVTDQDGAGNSVTETYTITEPEPLTFSITPVDNEVCAGECTGSFDYIISGGTQPYSYSWLGATANEFSKQKEITFDATEAATDYQVNITVSYDSDMQTDFDDIRFTDALGNSLSYWIESYTTSTEANVWVKVSSIAAGSNTIILQYGNATVNSTSSIENTMTSGGLVAKYYSDQGAGRSPVIDEANRVSTCIDDATDNDDRPIDHSWGSSAVDLCGQSYTNDVQISWEGWLKKPDDATGDAFQLRIGSDDGSRVMLDDATRTNPTVSYWYDRGYNTTTGSYTFSDDIVPIVFDWYENGGGASVTFEWNYPGNGSWEMVPQANYYYQTYSDNPPTNFVFGAETDLVNHQTNICEGTHTYTVTDNSGCQTSQTYTVAVEDDDPVITVSDFNETLETICSYSPPGDELDATATDNCTISSLVHDYNGGGTTLAGETFNPGTTTVTWTATDNAGNTASATQTITLNGPAVTPSVSGVVTDVQCPGDNNGSIDITVSDRSLLTFTTTVGGITVPDDNALDLTTNGTLEAWIKPNSIQTNGGIIQKASSASNESYSLQFYNGDLCIAITYGNNQYEYITWDGTVTLNNWHHVAASWDSDSLYLYFDSEKVASADINGHSPRSSDGILRIGHQYSGSNMDFDGEIRDVRIWDITLNRNQIAHYSDFTAVGASGLVAAYRIDEGSGTSVADYSSNNLTGTITEGTWGNPAYVFQWDEGSSSEDIGGLTEGTYTVYITSEYGCLLSDSWTVGVDDTQDPVITLATTPASVEANDAEGYLVSGTGWNATATDNCAINTLTHNFNGGGNSLDGVLLPYGTTTITWTATDNSGNNSTESFDIEVSSSIGPGGVTEDLEVWLRADKEVYSDLANTPASHVDPVEVWSGFRTGYDASQTDVDTRPSYRTAGAELINYNGYITFDGLNDSLVLNRTSVGLESENAVFMVINAHHYEPVLKFGDNAYITIGDNIEYKTSGTATTRTAANEITLDSWNLISIVKDGNNNGDIRFWVQGEETGYSSTGNSTITPGNNIVIGKHLDQYIPCHIAEIIIYKSALTTEERQRVESYLATKYGITM